jgi:hypothetical protein
LKITEAVKFLGYIFRGKHVFIFTKTGCAMNILGDFFTNSSGHSDSDPRRESEREREIPFLQFRSLMKSFKGKNSLREMKGIRKMCLPLIELHFPALLNFWSPSKKTKWPLKHCNWAQALFRRLRGCVTLR